MDWQKIEIEYITDPAASFRSLAEKYEIPRSTLEKRARREKWADRKKKSAVRTVEKAVKAHENSQKKADREGDLHRGPSSGSVGRGCGGAGSAGGPRGDQNQNTHLRGSCQPEEADEGDSEGKGTARRGADLGGSGGA
ncbi:MAG: hypothetical protein IJD10_07755 [Clostridia bacterium]|nr:hypothetical protein [Clostridia bacterium]